MSEATYHADRLTKRRRHPTRKKLWRAVRDGAEPPKKPWGKRPKGPVIQYSTGPAEPTLRDLVMMRARR